MITAKNFLYVAALLIVTQASQRCLAMDYPEDLRHETLDANAHKRLVEKMNTIISNRYQGLETLTQDDQYILLKRLFERSQEEPPLSYTKQVFFERLKAFVTPELLKRALPALSPGTNKHNEPIEEEPFQGYIPIPPGCNQP